MPTTLPLFFETSSGDIHPRYIKDLAGRVVLCGEAGDIHQPIPFALGLLEYHFSGEYPLPWEESITELENRITRYTTFNSGLRSNLTAAYPNGRLKNADDVYFKPGSDVDDQQVAKALSILNQKNLSPEDHEYLVSALSESGVHPIPHLPLFDERYHDVQMNQVIVGSFVVVKNGWATSDKVYCKSIIAPSD